MKMGVFISYAKEDKAFALRLYESLRQAGVKPWLDIVDLLPGQIWEAGIANAILKCRYFIALLSSRSVGKIGYVQREIRTALAIAEEYPESEIFIIPVRIDECEPTFEGLRRRHWTDIFSDYERGIKDLLRVFKYETEEKPASVKVDAGRKLGTIKKKSDRGFGFIAGEAPKDLFFHSIELIGIQFDELREGDAVYYWAAESPKGPIAINIERL